MTPDFFPILVVAGETSGEHHAAGLIQRIQQQNSKTHFSWFGAGGREMKATGVELLLDVSHLSAIGHWEALAYMRSYWKLYRQLVAEVRARRPQLAILVDFPEFNLRLARRLRSLNIPVCYFIGPQVWAWRSSRVKLIRDCVDLLLVILPFEEEFYRRHGVTAHYVGNPVVASIHRTASRTATIGDGSPSRPPSVPIIALLPGSRRKEIEHIFPIQLDAARFIADRSPVEFWVIKAPEIDSDFLLNEYEAWMSRGNPRLKLRACEQGTAHLLPQADCAIIKSGTSTLEAMLLQVPFVMVYKVSTPTWYIARPLMDTKTYCLANLVAGRKVVPEFIQHEATGENIGTHVLELLQNEHKRNQVKDSFRIAAQLLGDRDAYLEGARHVTSLLGTLK